MRPRASRCCPLAIVLAAAAAAQPLSSTPTERTFADSAGASTVHYSIDQFGPLYNASEYVCAGYRETLAGGRTLHLARFNGLFAPINEAAFLPPKGTHRDGRAHPSGSFSQDRPFSAPPGVASC